MMFSLDFSNQSRKFLKKSDKELRDRILKKIKDLRTEPVPHNAVRVVGEERTFRIRVGDYRVLYEVRWDKEEILIAVIDKISRVY
jgi:mRNA interferase RelE/StbE